jgi:hypothetical protein
MKKKRGNSCSSCGVKWEKHMGISGTCKENQKLMRIIEELRGTLKVITTLATFRDGQEMSPKHIEKLCKNALRIKSKGRGDYSWQNT